MRIRAGIGALVGTVVALGGIPGLVMSWLRDSVHPWTDWPEVASVGDFTWGRLCTVSQICAFVGVALLVFSLSRAGARIAAILGVSFTGLGLAGLVALYPAMEPVMHLKGHAILEELPRSEIWWMVSRLGVWYVFEITLLAGLLVLLVRLWPLLARGLRRHVRATSVAR